MTLSKVRMIFGALLVALCMQIASPGDASAQDEVVILTGNHWTQLEYDEKVAFMYGVLHVVEFERQLRGGAFHEEPNSFLPHLVKGLQGRTVNDVVLKVNEFYRLHPDQLDRPVFDAVFQSIVIPVL